jgi:hypothetical protein
MKRLLLLPLLACLALCACATTAQQTWDQSVTIAANLNDAVIVSANTLLTSRAITAPQARKIAGVTSQVTKLLTAANEAWVAGNMTVANQTLAIANSTATKTQACLHVTGSALDTCLAPIAGTTP